MAEQFSVVFGADRGKASVFEGSAQEIIAWFPNGFNPEVWEVYSPETKTYMSVVEFFKSFEPETTFVPKFYKMNPETDDLFPNGKHLANGMKVLIGVSEHRAKVSDEGMPDWLEDRALEMNRWCTVGAFEVDGDEIQFIGVYEDGSKRLRRAPVKCAWLVKINSVRNSVNLYVDRYNDICGVVHEALREAAGPEPTLDPFHEYPELDKIAEKTTKHILGIL